MTAEMTRVTAEGRHQQQAVGCPGCGLTVGLWLRLLTTEGSATYRTTHGWVDATASLAEPKDRLAAMERGKAAEAMSALVPWVACLTCGYDDHYTFGAPAAEPTS